jgi:hypothetical protein
LRRRTKKAGGSELTSIIKALSFPIALSSGCDARSGGPHSLDTVEEHDGDRMELSEDNVIIDRECPLKVRYF